MARYSVNNYTVETLLSNIKSGSIAIPEMQRPFVWDSSKVRDLVDSLYKGFPVGYIIVWQNPDVKLKDGTKSSGKKVLIDIKEIKRPDRDAQLVAENIAQQLENRVSFRRAMKSCMGRTMKSGALGIKTCCAGRLGGADMARTEFYSEGTIPLQTLRADIDYGFAEADTTYGKVGVKVWIYKGEVLPTKGNQMEGSDK